VGVLVYERSRPDVIRITGQHLRVAVVYRRRMMHLPSLYDVEAPAVFTVVAESGPRH
jgi:hypothetical protein